jgi:alkylation response protein AidB-like acyl-CoA dehydrogenase
MSGTDHDLNALAASIDEVLARECDAPAVRAFVDGDDCLAQRLWELAASLGWLGIGLPEADGGSGMGAKGLGALHRALGARTSPGPFIAMLTAAQALAECADAQVKQRYLPRVLSGELTLCMPANLATLSPGLSLVNGKLSGRKSAMLGAPGPGAALVPVDTGGGVAGWALIDIDGGSARLTHRPGWDRTRALYTLDCNAARPQLLVHDASAIAQWNSALGTHAALAVAFDSLGAAQATLAQSIDYLKGRVQFGKPLATFQALKHRVAELHIELELTRTVVQQAAQAAHTGSPDRQAWAWQAKQQASEALARVAQEGVQLHGGVGHTWEFACHVYLKRGRLNLLLGATSEQALDLAADALSQAAQTDRSALELPQ